MITVSCTTAPSVPRVICNTIYECNHITPVLCNPLTIMNTQQCNVSLKVVYINDLTETLDQETYTNIAPLEQPTTSVTTVLSPSATPPTGKHNQYAYMYI